jgi:hypothetical protein
VSSYPGILPGWIIFDLDAPHPEPLAFNAGDSLAWNRGFEQYPASGGWTLTYVLNNQSQKYVVSPSDITVDGDGFSVAIPSSETKTWTAGEYLWLAVMQNTVNGVAERFTCAMGRVAIQADILDASAPVDTRALEEIALANIKAVLAGRAGDGVQEYKINDRELRRYSMAELFKLKSYFESEVRKIRIKHGETVLPDTVAFHADWGLNG